MNKLKTNTRILLILIISAFIVIPTAAVLVSKLFGVQENMENYDMSNKNVKMDRIKAEADGGYLYCIGGDVTCSDGTSDLIGDTTAEATYYDNSGNEHNSYSASCGTDAYAMCTNYISTKTGDNSITFFNSSGDDISYSGPSDDKYKGFLGPYNYHPMNISGKYVYLYDSENSGYSSEAFSACYLYGDCPQDSTGGTTSETAGDSTGGTTSETAGDSTGGTTTETSGDSTSGTTSETSGDSTPENSNVSTMKCIADNGAKPGDPLCCGQDGVLQDTKYNCHSDYPYCIGYKCGETWGKCSTTAQ